MTGSDKKPTLDRLVDDHLPETLRFAIRLTGNPETAEEIVQESLLRVVQNWVSFRGESEFRTWLYRIVINVFRDKLRSDDKTKSLQQDVRDNRDVDPSSAAQVEEMIRFIAARVSELPPRQREVLVLITYESLTTVEVAEVLGITESNVHATLHVARGRLRKELASYLVGK